MGHDPKTKRLAVQYRKSGAVYEYSGVSRQKATAGFNAGSIGRWINRSVKPNHAFTKVSSGTRTKRKGRKR
jgi:hypothetical protein